MPRLSMNSRLVSVTLWSECSFIRHTDKIVVLKTQICVFPHKEEMGLGAGYLCPDSHLGEAAAGRTQWPCGAEARRELWGMGEGAGRADKAKPKA